MKINVYTTGFKFPNVRAFIYPLIKFNNFFKRNGLFFNLTSKLDSDCDIIFIESNVIGDKYHKNIKSVLNQLKDLRKRVKKIVYFDTSDSTSLLHPTLLDYVDLYCKSQIYSEIKNYTKKYYGNRIFTDYCYRNFNVKDGSKSFSEVVKKKHNLNKIKLFWNSGILNHSFFGKILSQLYYFFPVNIFLTSPDSKVYKKKQNLFYYMTTEYYRKSVAWHRERAFEILKIKIPARKNIFKYYRSLAKSRICISPFGWGEINYRDFEAMIYGAILLKPKMSHLNTWPNIYTFNSVIMYDWSCDDLKTKIEQILGNYDHYHQCALNSQLKYAELLKPTELRGKILKIIKDIIRE